MIQPLLKLKFIWKKKLVSIASNIKSQLLKITTRKFVTSVANNIKTLIKKRQNRETKKSCDDCNNENIQDNNKPKQKFSNRKNKRAKDMNYGEKDFFKQLSNYFTGIDKFLFTNICTYHNLLMNALNSRVNTTRIKLVSNNPITSEI